MSDPKPFPYVTNLNVQFQPLELIDEKALADASPHQWYNQTLCNVNGSVVRLGVIQGEYHWHKHDNDDEFFYVVEGQLLIDLEGRTLDLGPRQGVRGSQRRSASNPCPPAHRDPDDGEQYDRSNRRLITQHRTNAIGQG